jgi:tetratricopeptide (TPR) repeat protein
VNDLSGKSIRGYDLLERVGAGGFGIVYRAHQPAVRRDVALKVILPDFAHHPEFVQRFEVEAQLVARLEHPFIVPLYDYWRDANGACLVMRWLRGGNLRDRLRKGPIPLNELSRMFEQIANALAFAHAHQVIHRDLKPENILLDETGNAYLTDFGIAKDLGSDRVTEAGKIIGSVDYMSPEQVQGEPASARTDVYGLGLMIFELLTGEHPFADLNLVQMIQKQLNEPLPSLYRLRPDLPAELDGVIQRATAKDPTQRYPDAETLLREFLSACAATTPAAPAAVQIPSFLTQPEAAEERQFVGRSAELQSLQGSMDKVFAGQGQILFVTGDTGRGKSSLLQEFARRAQAAREDLLVASGRCDIYTGLGDPYLPFRGVLGLLAGDVESRWAAGAVTRDQAVRLWTASPATIEALVQHGPDLLGYFVPLQAVRSRLAATHLGGRVGLQRIAEVLERIEQAPAEAQPHPNRILEEFTLVLFSLAQRHPLLLLLDDLQWIDPSSANLLFHLARRIQGRPIMIVGTYRPEDITQLPDGSAHPLEPVLNELKRTFGHIWIDLDAEDASSTRHLVDSLVDMEPNDLGEQFRHGLTTITEGHPLFVLELLKDLQERGELVRGQSGQWRQARPIDWQLTPARVEGVIEKRIGRLDPELREVLGIAAVQGEVFTAEAVARVHGMEERALVRRLSWELERQHRLVQELGAERMGLRRLSQFRFRHLLIQRYLYRQRGASERAYLHEALGNALEELVGDQNGRVSIQLARHFDEAGLTDRAIFHLQRAGERALKLSAYQEATGHLRRALSLAETRAAEGKPVERLAAAHMERLLGEATYALGDLNGSRELLERSARRLGRGIPAQVGPAILGEVARQVRFRLLPRRGSQPDDPRRAELREAAGVYKTLTEIYIVSTENARTLFATLGNLNLAEAAGPSPELARAYADMSAVAPLLGLRSMAEKYRSLAYETARALESEAVTAYVQIGTSVFTVGQGRWQEGGQSLDQAISAFRHLGDWNRLGLTLVLRTHVHIFKGEFEAFQSLHRDLADLAERSGGFQHMIWARDGEAESLLRLGGADRLPEVVARLQQNLAEMNRAGFELEQAHVYSLLVQAHLRRGDWAAAREAGDAGSQIIARARPTFYSQLEGYAGPAHAYLGCWQVANDSSEAKILARQAQVACRRLRKFAGIFPVARPRSLRLDGLYRWLSGDRRGAVRTWDAGVALARRLGMRYEEALTHLELLRRLKPGTAARPVHLAQAGSLLRQLPAPFELAELKHWSDSEADLPLTI